MTEEEVVKAFDELAAKHERERSTLQVQVSTLSTTISSLNSQISYLEEKVDHLENQLNKAGRIVLQMLEQQ